MSSLISTDKSSLNLSSTQPLRDFVRDANSERIKSLLDNRVGVVAAMALISLHLSMDIFTPKPVEGGSSTYFTLIKLILGSLAVIVLGNMLLKSKLKDEMPSLQADILKSSFDMKAVNTVTNASSDEILGAVQSDVARKQWDIGADYISKESET